MAAAAARFDDTSNTAGPFIKFGNLVGDSWTGSILFMTRNDTTPPSAKLYVRSNPSSSVRRRLEPKLLDTCHGWRFWRFEVAVTLCPEETAVDYEVTATGLVKKATFWVQASGKPFHVGYTSCNGISLSIPAGHYARQDPGERVLLPSVCSRPALLSPIPASYHRGDCHRERAARVDR